MEKEKAIERIEEIRHEIINQRVSYGELLELYELREFVDINDLELMQWIYDEEEYNALNNNQ